MSMSELIEMVMPSLQSIKIERDDKWPGCVLHQPIEPTFAIKVCPDEWPEETSFTVWSSVQHQQAGDDDDE